MDWLRQYSLNIVVVLVFSAFVALVLPGGKYKEYIKLVTGIIVILIIISPAAELINYHSYEGLLKQAQLELDMKIAGKEIYYHDASMVKAIIELYSEDIKNQLGKNVRGYGFRLEYANIIIDESEEDFGKITGIDLILSKAETQKEEAQGFIKVDKIRLEPVGKEISENSGQDSEEIKKIKNFISGFYNLSADNIHIKVQ